MPGRIQVMVIAVSLTSVCLTRFANSSPPVSISATERFERLAGDEHSGGAAKSSQTVFDVLLSKYPGHEGLIQFHKRLETARRLAEVVLSGLEMEQSGALAQLTDPDLIAAPVVSGAQKDPSEVTPSAEQLYWTCLPTFSAEPNLQGLKIEETRFVHRYYDFEMQALVEQICGEAAKTVLFQPEAGNLSCYAVVLPLLHMPEADRGWQSCDALFGVFGPKTLQAMSDFCLLSVERPRTALAISRYRARAAGTDFPLVAWVMEASEKCVDNHRPDLAERLLNVVVESLTDEHSVVELRLKIVEGYSRCGDYGKAATECAKVAEDFPHSPMYGRIMCLFLTQLAKQEKAEELLAGVDEVLQRRDYEAYRPQLMYLKWWALRKTNQHAAAGKVGQMLVKGYPQAECTAPVLLAEAADLLASQQYDECRRLLYRLVDDFPRTHSAVRAQKILGHLGEN